MAETFVIVHVDSVCVITCAITSALQCFSVLFVFFLKINVFVSVYKRNSFTKKTCSDYKSFSQLRNWEPVGSKSSKYLVKKTVTSLRFAPGCNMTASALMQTQK